MKLRRIQHYFAWQNDILLSEHTFNSGVIIFQPNKETCCQFYLHLKKSAQAFLILFIILLMENLDSLENFISDNDISFYDPYKLFAIWLDQAVVQKISNPNSMCLSTVSIDNRPSSRYLNISGLPSIKKGFVFGTDYSSRKAADFSKNPFASMTFWWDALQRQVRVEGKVEKISSNDSDILFSKLARGV